jgi:magnesium transporter
MPIASILTPELREMLEMNDAAGLREFCEAMHPASTAEFLEELNANEIWQVLSHTEAARQAGILQYFPEPHKLALVQSASRDRIARIIEAMASDDRVDLVKDLDPELRDNLLPLVAQAEREDIRRLLSYPEDSVGAVMTTDYAWFPEDLTAGEALARLRLIAPDRETIYYVYVLDANRRLVGVVTLRQLIMAKPAAKLAEFMERTVISVQVDENKEQAAQKLAHYDFIAMPVVDAEGRLVGIITHDDVMDVVVQAATEDAYRMGAVGPIEEGYLQVKFGTLWRTRSFWLSCLFVGELFTVFALAGFDETIAAIPALTMFIPLCISTGGNSGSQAATLITRAMALGQVGVKDWFRVLRHELVMGVALGISLGLLGLAVMSLLPMLGFLGPEMLKKNPPWKLSLVISQSVMAICMAGTLLGSMLPLGFKRLGVDPGVASSPFVATLVDVTGNLIYFTLATIYLL